MEIPEEHLFQVYMDTELFKKRLKLTKPFSSAVKKNVFGNCSNLVQVILGISNPDYYLSACTARKTGTSTRESEDYIANSLHQCGIQASVKGKDYLLTGLNFFNYFNTNLRTDHATLLDVKWKDADFNHAVVLWKDYRGILHYVDPQSTNSKGEYPLQIWDRDLIKYLKENVVAFQVYTSDKDITINQEKSRSSKCITDISPMWMNNPEATTIIFTKKAKKPIRSKKQGETYRSILLKTTMERIAKKSRKSKGMGTKKSRALGSLASKRLAKNKLTRRAQRSIAAWESKLKLTKRLNTKKSVAKKPKPASK